MQEQWSIDAGAMGELIAAMGELIAAMANTCSNVVLILDQVMDSVAGSEIGTMEGSVLDCVAHSASDHIVK